jgi:hypothetical protein
VGCGQLAIDTTARTIALGGKTLHEGDMLWIDAETGLVFANEPAIVIDRPLDALAAVASWKQHASPAPARRMAAANAK